MTRNPAAVSRQSFPGAHAVAAVVMCLLAIGAAGCASTGAVPRPFPAPTGPGGSTGPAVPPGAIPGSEGYAIAGTALAFQGVPYRSGGEDPSGFDCSGLVQYVLRQHDISWPRLVRDQFEAGRRIPEANIEPGDLVFFVTEGRDVSHVGIAIGGDQFVHAPNSRGVVRVDSLSAPYWHDRFAGARRVDQN